MPKLDEIVHSMKMAQAGCQERLDHLEELIKPVTDYIEPLRQFIDDVEKTLDMVVEIRKQGRELSDEEIAIFDSAVRNFDQISIINLMNPLPTFTPTEE